MCTNPVVIIVAVLCSATTACVDRPENRGRAESAAAPAQACAVAPAPDIRVRSLSSSRRVNVDAKLDEWTAELKIAEVIVPQSWTGSRVGESSATASTPLLTVYMSYDGDFWYIGVATRDDTPRPGLPGHPYTGDSFELFVAGDRTDAPQDMHDLLDLSQTRRALGQIQLPRILRGLSEYHVSEYRTDPALMHRIVEDGLVAKSASSPSGWSAELRLPFKAFDDRVLDRIKRQLPLKVGFDYLNYVKTIVTDRNEANRWGFVPDQVYADSREANVNVPSCMRALFFER